MKLAKIENTEITEAREATPVDLLPRFIAYLEVSPKSVETYTKAIRHFFDYLTFNGISRPERKDVVAYREWLKEGHKPTTVQSYITAVKIFFQWAEDEGLYPNIARRIKGAKVDNKKQKKDSLTPSQVKKVLDVARGKSVQALRDYAVLVLMFTGGLRTIEVSRANIEDLRPNGDQTVLYIQGKGYEEKSDYIKLDPRVETAIRDYLKARGTVKPEDPLFTSESYNGKGRRLSTRTVSKIVKNAFIEAGYDDTRLTAHSTRHTAVTLALLNGRSIQEVQQFARHKSIATTLIYAHNLEKANNRCEATIADAIL